MCDARLGEGPLTCTLATNNPYGHVFAATAGPDLSGEVGDE